MRISTMEESSIIPGYKIKPDETQIIFKKFRKKFRRFSSREVETNVPTACVLKGIRNPDAFDDEKFLSIDKVYLLFEYDKDLRIATPEEICAYYKNLQPWEYNDFCVFDETYSWCIGMTHDDVILVDDPDRQVTTKAPNGERD